MRTAPIAMCCWPGLPRLWFCGEWYSLSIALAFGGVLNLLLVSACARPEWLPWPVNIFVWAAVGGCWLISTARAYRNWPELDKPAGVTDDRGLFLQAQSEYLKGHWFEAENVLGDLVRHSHQDVEARLLLATLYRHTKRFEAASGELDRLERFDGAAKWQSEIGTERRLIARERLLQAKRTVQGTSSVAEANAPSQDPGS